MTHPNTTTMPFETIVGLANIGSFVFAVWLYVHGMVKPKPTLRSLGTFIGVMAFALLLIVRTVSTDPVLRRETAWWAGAEVTVFTALLLVVASKHAAGRRRRRGKFIVLIATFDGPKPQSFRVTETIRSRITTALRDFPDTLIVSLEATFKQATGSGEARRIARRFGASLVLWGWYGATRTDARVTINVENLMARNAVLSVSSAYDAQAAIADLSSFQIQDTVSAELSALVLFLSGYARLGVGDFAEAARRLEAAADELKWPGELVEKSTLAFILGLCYIHMQLFQRAIEAFSSALAYSPAFVEALINRGAAYWRIGSNADAEVDLSAAIQLRPDNAFAYNNRGSVRSSLGDNNGSWQDFDAAVQLMPDYSHAYYNRAIESAALGQIGQALRDYDACISLSPEFQPAYLNRAILTDDCGDVDLAMIELGSIIQRWPNLTNAYVHRAQIHIRRGEWRGAITDLTKVLELDPTDAKSLTNRGCALQHVGDMEHALRDFDTAMELQPNVITRYDRALLLNNTGKAAAAVLELRRVVEDDTIGDAGRAAAALADIIGAGSSGERDRVHDIQPDAE